jgi:hypothetical protein
MARPYRRHDAIREDAGISVLGCRRSELDAQAFTPDAALDMARRLDKPPQLTVESRGGGVRTGLQSGCVR